MKYHHPLLLLTGVLLSGCKEDPPEVEEVKEVVLKADTDTVLMCVQKTSGYSPSSGDVVPKFTLRDDRGCNGCGIDFDRVGSYWCYWQNRFVNGKSVTFALEAANGQASDSEELLVWFIRQGSEIEKVTELKPHMLVGNDNGVYRATVVRQEPGSQIMLVSPDYVIQIPDVAE